MRAIPNIFLAASAAGSPILDPSKPDLPLDRKARLQHLASNLDLKMQRSQDAIGAPAEGTAIKSTSQVNIPTDASSTSESITLHPTTTSSRRTHQSIDSISENSSMRNTSSISKVLFTRNAKNPSQAGKRPSTRAPTPAPSLQQSIFSFMTAGTRQEREPRFGTPTTISTGPSGRRHLRESPLKRLVKLFQRNTSGRGASDAASVSSLDSALTCRGPPKIEHHEEVKVTSSDAPPVPSLGPRARDEDVICHFATRNDKPAIDDAKKLLDANDDSLQRYKQSLGLGGGKDLSDPNDPRVCIIQSLTMESPGRDPVTIDLSKPGSEATLKDQPFKIKEGSKFTMVVTFKVQHEILSGLQYVQVVKRKGLKVGKDSEMLVSFQSPVRPSPMALSGPVRIVRAG